METRRRLGAVLGAGALLLLAATATIAVPPTYTIDADKDASPANVPPSGGNVTYTITVWATGTGNLATIVVDDGMAGCTLSGPTGDDGDGKLEPGGEVWSYTCTVLDVEPGTQNTATVSACHDSSPGCASDHDDQATAAVTVGEGPEVSNAPTTPPGTQDPGNTGDPEVTLPPGGDPSQDAGDETLSPTDATVLGVTIPGNNVWLLVVALGLLLAGVVLFTPTRPIKQR